MAPRGILGGLISAALLPLAISQVYTPPAPAALAPAPAPAPAGDPQVPPAPAPPRPAPAPAPHKKTPKAAPAPSPSPDGEPSPAPAPKEEILPSGRPKWPSCDSPCQGGASVRATGCDNMGTTCSGCSWCKNGCTNPGNPSLLCTYEPSTTTRLTTRTPRTTLTPLPSGCVVTGYYYDTFPRGPEIQASDVIECQMACAEMTTCEHFSFWPDGGCVLQDATAELVDSVEACRIWSKMPEHKGIKTCAGRRVMSGPRDCADPDTYPDLKLVRTSTATTSTATTTSVTTTTISTTTLTRNGTKAGAKGAGAKGAVAKDASVDGSDESAEPEPGDSETGSDTETTRRPTKAHKKESLQSSKGGGMPGWAVALIVLGVIACCGVTAVVLFMSGVCSRGRSAPSSEDEDEEESDEAPPSARAPPPRRESGSQRDVRAQAVPVRSTGSTGSARSGSGQELLRQSGGRNGASRAGRPIRSGGSRAGGPAAAAPGRTTRGLEMAQVESSHLLTPGGQPADIFDTIDANHDGVITRAEWEQAAAASPAVHAPAVYYPGAVMQAPQLPVTYMAAPQVYTSGPVVYTTGFPTDAAPLV